MQLKGYLLIHLVITLTLLQKSSVKHKKRTLVECSRCSFAYNEIKWCCQAPKNDKKQHEVFIKYTVLWNTAMSHKMTEFLFLKPSLLLCTDCVQKAVMITQMQTPSAHRGLTQPYTDTHAHKHFIFCSSLSVSKQLIEQLAGFFRT